MKLSKLLFFAFILTMFTFTACERDNIDEVMKEEKTETKVENKIISKLVTSPTGGLDLGCVTVNYPFSLLTINDNEVAVTSDEEFEAALMDSVDYIIDFVYPLAVTDSDGNNIDVNNIDELGELFASCIPDSGWTGDEFPAFLINQDNSCFDLVYPVDLEDVDGAVTTVADEGEFVDALADNDLLFFVFPLTLENSDGQLNVNNSDELFNSLYACDTIPTSCDSITWGGELACYEISFPINLELIDGSIVTANNVDELNEILFSNEVLGFSYPITLIDFETGEDIIINNDDELTTAFEACGIVVFAGIPADLLYAGVEQGCYEVVYPINCTDFEGNVISVTSDQELEDVIMVGGYIEEPVTLIQGGTTYVVESIEDLFVILENC